LADHSKLRYHSHKAQFLAILVPKIDAMATAVRHSISTVFSSDNLTPKTQP